MTVLNVCKILDIQIAFQMVAFTTKRVYLNKEHLKLQRSDAGLTDVRERESKTFQRGKHTAKIKYNVE